MSAMHAPGEATIGICVIYFIGKQKKGENAEPYMFRSVLEVKKEFAVDCHVEWPCKAKPPPPPPSYVLGPGLTGPALKYPRMWSQRALALAVTILLK